MNQRGTLESVHVSGFGCLLDTEVRLTPLHALIGPNDSGKSLLLRAIRTALQLGGGYFRTEPSWAPFDLSIAALWPNGRVVTRYTGDLEYMVSTGSRKLAESVTLRGEVAASRPRDPVDNGLLSVESEGTTPLAQAPRTLRDLVRPAPLLRLDPDELRRPGALILSDQEPHFLGERGTGIASLYDAILNRNVDGFLAIASDVRRLFPTVKNIGLQNVSPSHKQLEIELLNDQRVPAALMSEGLLLYLAYAALPHLTPTRMLLIEEPENGLHPARITEVMNLLREVSKSTQVLLTTHSPLVINELEADEVTVLTRDREKGTVATPIDQTPNFEERRQVYSLGELWLAYCDGESEAPLFSGRET